MEIVLTNILCFLLGPTHSKTQVFLVVLQQKVPIQPKECLSHRHQQSKPGDVRAAF